VRRLDEYIILDDDDDDVFFEDFFFEFFLKGKKVDETNALYLLRKMLFLITRGILLHLSTLLQRVCLSVCLSSARKRRRARISPPFFFWHACARVFLFDFF